MLANGIKLLTESLASDVENNGTGLQADLDELKGMGIRVMEYRPRIIGAALHVESLSHFGTVVARRLPREHAFMGDADDGASLSAAETRQWAAPPAVIHLRIVGTSERFLISMTDIPQTLCAVLDDTTPTRRCIS